MTCAVNECHNPPLKRNLCAKHYRSFQYCGSPVPIKTHLPDRPGEIWRPLPGYEALYKVSNQGRVKALGRSLVDANGHERYKREKLLKPQPNGRTGHQRVTLYVGSEKQRFFVHRLVLEAFIGPCPEGMECCHNNGDPTENRLENLRWDTRSANTIDKFDHHGRAAHCKNGHAFTPENTGSTRGRRYCRICIRAKNNAAYAKRRLRKAVEFGCTAHIERAPIGAWEAEQ